MNLSHKDISFHLGNSFCYGYGLFATYKILQSMGKHGNLVHNDKGEATPIPILIIHFVINI